MSEGKVVAGRYRLLSLLGAGGMGEVWLAEDELLGRQVAVKLLLARQGPAGPDMTQRMMREARTAARLSHPNAVAVHDLIVDGDQPYVVMEYVSGYTLEDGIKQSGRLEPSTAASIIGQVASAVAAAHRLSIVHRDIKPANILITSEGVARLADFGIARTDTDSQLTGTGLVIGSLAYMAPEVAEGDQATALSDVWSLGATLFAAVEGQAPFQGETTVRMLYRLFHEDAPTPTRGGHLNDLISRMLARDPAGRPTSADVSHELAPGATAIAEAAYAASSRQASIPDGRRQLPVDDAVSRRSVAPTTAGPAPRATNAAPRAIADPTPVAPTTIGPAPDASTGAPPGSAPADQGGSGQAPTHLGRLDLGPTAGRKSPRKWYLIGGGVAAAAVLGVSAFLVLPSSSSPGAHSSSSYHYTSTPPTTSTTVTSSSTSSPVVTSPVLAAQSWTDFAPFSATFGTYDSDTANAWRGSNCHFYPTSDTPEQLACTVDTHVVMYMNYYPDGATAHVRSGSTVTVRPWQTSGIIYGRLITTPSLGGSNQPSIEGTFCSYPRYYVTLTAGDSTIDLATLTTKYWNPLPVPHLTACADQTTGIN